MAILQTKNLTKIYGSGESEVRALDGVSITVDEGEFVAVVGTSGSGKSTLLNMIGGLDRPTSGSVLIRDKNLLKMKEEALTIFRRRNIGFVFQNYNLLPVLGGLDRPTSGSVLIRDKNLLKMKEEALTIFRRRNIGFVFQNYNLLPVLNVYENIVYPIEIDGGRTDTAFVREIIETLGLEKKLKNMPSTLSGGQQQRVAIARALATKPAIILADEPTGNLDSKTSMDVILLMQAISRQFHQTQRVAIARALATKPAIILADEPTGNLDSKTSMDVILLMQAISRQFHQTTMMITHNEEIAQMADRIIRIEDGKVLSGGAQYAR